MIFSLGALFVRGASATSTIFTMLSRSCDSYRGDLAYQEAMKYRKNNCDLNLYILRADCNGRNDTFNQIPENTTVFRPHPGAFQINLPVFLNTYAPKKKP